MEAYRLRYLELHVALSASHVEGALERGDAIAGARPIPAAKLVALIDLSSQERGRAERIS